MCKVNNDEFSKLLTERKSTVCPQIGKFRIHIVRKNSMNFSILPPNRIKGSDWIANDWMCVGVKIYVTTWNEFQGGNFIWNMINNRWLTADAHFIFFKQKAKAWNLWNKSDRGATTYYILIAIDVIRVRASQKERESLSANWEIYHKWCEMRQPQPSCERGKKSLCVKESYGANKMNDMFSSVQKERKSSVIFNKKKSTKIQTALTRSWHENI